MLRSMTCNVILLAATGAGISGAQAQTTTRLPDGGGTLITFDVQNAGSQPYVGGTFPLANNDEGFVVGYTVDINEVPHGFIRRPDGHIETIDAPGAGLGHGLDQGTYFYSINDLGIIGGAYQDSNNAFHAFLRNPDGHYELFPKDAPEPGPYQGMLVLSVNLQGASTGVSIDSSGTYHGFVRSIDGHIDLFDPKGSLYTYPCEETCINAAGQITGFFYDANNVSHGFVREPNGKITVIDGPDAGTNAGAGTTAASINPQGDIAGYTFDSNGIGHGFIRKWSGQYLEFDAPKPKTGITGGIAAFSINPFLTTTGIIVSSSGAYTGFSRSERGELKTFSANGGGTGAGQGTRPSTNNAQGEVAGWYVDAGNVAHGFLWLPCNYWDSRGHWHP